LLSVADKRLNDLKEFGSSVDTVAKWLNMTTAKVQSLAASVPSSDDDARGVLDACRTCLEELSLKQRDLDCLAAMARALHRGDVNSLRTVYDLNSRYTLTTKKLKVWK